jgi:serine/threonine-protein kinase PknG
MKCHQPQCDGVIADGYCDVCGLAPRPARDPGTEAIDRDARWGRSIRPDSNSIAILADAQPARPASTTSTSATPQRRLGAGLIDIPPVHIVDPATAVLSNPQVAERNRYCKNPSCGEAVGRSRDGSPGLTTGYCRRCRTPFTFEPKLAPGDLVAEQYEIVGCLAHGGLGWVYLARDRKVGFYVALKGLLDPDDDEARKAAAAERQFLAEIAHPNIVKIHNYVEHAGDSYIVMEYVSGESLKQMLAKRRQANGGVHDPLPVPEAIVYCLEVLPAFDHLHGLGLLYCDFKPENLIRTEHSLKLIDLGGAYRMGDAISDVWGTRGFKAPELSETGPTIETDLYTVGRTLAVLCTDFPTYQTDHEYSLPPRESVHAYVVAESLYRFLERSTAPDPRDRFHSASEMADQLEGVLYQVVAIEPAGSGERRRRTSSKFTPQSRGANNRPDVHRLPAPLVDPDDPNAGMIITMSSAAPDDVLRRLDTMPGLTSELRLWKVRNLIEVGRLDDAQRELDTLDADEPYDWRRDWFRGLAALVAGRPDEAALHFERVHRWLPGELAPMLGLAFVAEAMHDVIGARNWYSTVAHTDSSFSSAAFGLARCERALDEPDGALLALRLVPETANSFVEARITEVDVLLDHGRGVPPLANVVEAAAIVESVPLDGEQRGRLTARVLESALDSVCGGGQPTSADTVFEIPLVERELRTTLESTYRSLAHRAGSSKARIELVDRANRVRPRTLL